MSGSHTNIAFCSNAQVINRRNIDFILDKPVAHIDFSLDAATPETYYKIRGHNLKTFGTVLNNIRKLVFERNKRRLDKPTMDLIMVLMKENYQELSMLVRLANSLGVEGVRYWTMRKPSHAQEYRNHKRYDFLFSFEEQTKMDGVKEVIEQAKYVAEILGLKFLEN
jgi:MoaA/NifB/PqqE/SkfB family radical SAM enzyme